MQVVVSLHEQHVGQREHDHRRDKIEPVGRDRVRHQVHHPQRDRQLQDHVEQRHRHVAQPQLVRHQLVRVLAVRLSEILVQQDSVHDRAHAVHPVDRQEHQPGDVARLQDQTPDQVQQDERHSDAPDISREALRSVLRPEIEDAEDQHRQERRHHQPSIRERAAATRRSVHQQQRYQHRQRVARRDAVDPVHEIIDVRRPHADDQRRRARQRPAPPRHPQGAVVPHELHEQKAHRRELRHETDRIPQRAHVIREAHPGRQRHPGQQPGIPEAEEHAPQPHAHDEDDPPAADHHLRVGTAAVGPVHDVETLRHAEIQQLRHHQEQRHQ